MLKIVGLAMLSERRRVVGILVLWLCWLLGSFFTTDTLEVETLKGIVNKSITLPCKLSGYKNSLDLTMVGINWKRLNNDSVIYTFIGEKREHKPNRSGSTMLENEIKEGNAALHLTQIQLHEEGRYQCDFFVGASKTERIVVLEVSAQPEASLTPTEIEDISGVERSISCHMEGFYPELIKIIWKKEDIVISKEICTGSAEKIEDGTYRVTSNVRLKLTKEDHQKIVTCIMEHRSFPSPLHLNATLIVVERDASFASNLLYILIPVILFCMVLLFVFAGLIYFFYFKPVAPRMTQITGNKELVHKEKANLSCQVTGFRPKDLLITVLLKKPQDTERCIVYKKHFNEQHTSSNTLKSPAAEVQIDLLSEPRQTSDSIHCEAEIEHNMHSTFSLTLNIAIIPDIEEHNGAELFVTSEHCTNSSSRTCKLKIVGVPPKILEIMEPPKILHQESLMLGCSINGFKPRPLKITWVKINQRNEEEKVIEYTIGRNKHNDGPEVISDKYLHTTNENQFPDGTYNLYSVLNFVPTFEADHEAIFFCKTHHHETNTVVEKKLQLFVKASPILDPIHADPDIPNLEDTLILSCRIHSFFPQYLEANWYIDGEEMNGVTSDVIGEPDGLFSCTSSISFCPQIQDVGKTLQCRVGHESLKNHKGFIKPKETTWNLTVLICCPKQIKILCDPVDPEQGKSVTLTCIVQDYYPEACEVKWFQGGIVPMCTATLEEPESCKETALYRRRSKITFTPTAENHNTQYSVEVTHCNNLFRRTHLMILKGFPLVKDITLDPVYAVYGQPLTLSCQVMGCDPEDITVTWFQKDIQILKGFTTKEPSMTTKDCTSRCYQLSIIPTAAHYNEVFICNVKHRNLPRPIIKQMYLSLEKIPPVASDITVTPAEPEVGKTVSVKIDVLNFSPKEIQIKWRYKGWRDIPNATLTFKDPKFGENDLYVARSMAEIIPTQSDNGMEISCEIQHSATKTVLERKIILKLKGTTQEKGDTMIRY